MLSFPHKRRVCCSGHLIAPGVAKEPVDSSVIESSLKGFVTVHCSVVCMIAQDYSM